MIKMVNLVPITYKNNRNSKYTSKSDYKGNPNIYFKLFLFFSLVLLLNLTAVSALRGRTEPKSERMVDLFEPKFPVKTCRPWFLIQIGDQEVGKLEIEMFEDTPKTCWNFISLTKGHSVGGYKGSSFHRVIPGFMMQGGDFNKGNGTGGKSINNDKFKDENFKRKHTGRGTLSMANAGENTNGSQFFILFDKAEWLDGKHVVFGKVIRGMEVLDAVEKVGSGNGSVNASKKVIIKDCGVEMLSGEEPL